MRWLVLVSTVASGLLATGCFFVEPINERPSADIVQVDPAQPGRGAPIEVVAAIVDPDGDPTDATWTAFACNDTTCDAAPFDSSATKDYAFTAPVYRADHTPATRVHVELVVVDSYGAVAEPRQQVDITLSNAAPVLAELETRGSPWRGNFPVGTAVTIVAQATDLDDGAAALTYADPQLFPPANVPLEAATLTRLVDNTPGEAMWQLVSTQPGTWQLDVSVADPLGDTDEKMAAIPIAADQPPCLGVADPAFPPAGAHIVLDQLRRFAVDTVDDDLDPFPGTGSFRWFLSAAGGPMQPLSVDGNAVELDPAHYQPGDDLELRVEAVDRVDRPLCDASLPTCEAVPGCFQRQTWSLEVR